MVRIAPWPPQIGSHGALPLQKEVHSSKCAYQAKQERRRDGGELPPVVLLGNIRGVVRQKFLVIQYLLVG